MRNILGVSIGTRNVGMAVIRLRRLRDFRIRTFEGKWTEAKCRSIVDVVEGLVIKNDITDIVVKIPPPTHCSENIQELLRGFEAMAYRHHIEIHHCTIKDILLNYTHTKRSNKQVMVASLIDKYPQLQHRWKRGIRAELYNAKLFEAIACAELALRAGH